MWWLISTVFHMKVSMYIEQICKETTIDTNQDLRSSKE